MHTTSARRQFHWGNWLYWVLRWLLRVAAGFYFNRIERFHAKRAPLRGPVLFVSNHPNSLTDAFIIATSVPRKVNFVATVQIFRWPVFRWLLSRCGVIPLNRVKDAPRAMRTVRDSFEACFRVLRQEEAIAIFPEGITHDDPQLKTVKTGAARMALELEHHHQGRLGLQIAPVGLTFSAKERFRSDALVLFGEPIRAADFLAGYPERKHDCIQTLTTEIKERMEALILHLPRLERTRVVEAVKRLYLDRLLVGNRVIHEPVPPRTGELLLTQAIAVAVDYIYANHPDRAARFINKLDHYERWLKRLRLSDEELAQFSDKSRLLGQSVLWSLLAVMLAPVALYGWLHGWVPALITGFVIRRSAGLSGTPRTHVSTAAILAGLLSFGLLYGGFIAAFHAVFGLPASFWYGLSLPVATLIAHYYGRELQRFAVGLRAMVLLVRTPAAGRRLTRLRSQLIAEIEAARWLVPDEALKAKPKGQP